MKHPQTLFEPMLRKLLTATRKRLMPWIILTPDTSGDEPVLRREQELPPVQKIEISGMWHVIADFNADTDQWAVSAAESLLPALDITCRRGRLRIRMKKVDSLPAAPELRLQLRRLPQRITMSGMSMLRGKSGIAEKLKCRVDGMSELHLKACRLETLRARIGGMSRLKLSGSCELGDIALRGAAQLEAKGRFDTLKLAAAGAAGALVAAVRCARVRLGGIARLDINAQEELSGAAGAASTLHYTGAVEPSLRRCGHAVVMRGKA